MVRAVLRAMGSPLTPDIRNEARNEITHQYLTAAKARRMLDWAPRFTLDDGLRETIAWYREYLGAADHTKRAAVKADG